MQGVGLSFSRPFAWQKLPSPYQIARSMVSDEDILRYSVVLYGAVVCNCDLSKINEKKVGTGRKGVVQIDHLDELARFMSFIKTTTARKSSLEDQNCKDGVATPTSDADAYIENTRGDVIGISDVKHSTDSPEEPLRQAFSASTNVALARIKQGVPWADVCVPIFVSNGRLMQFALTCILQPSFPYMITLTKNLDLLDDNDRLEAAKQLQIIFRLSESDQPLGSSRCITMKLSRRYYYLKEATAIFQICHNNLQLSLFRMFNLLEKLCHKSTEKFVLFPLTYRTGSKSFINDALVFSNLTTHRIGLPDDLLLRKQLICEFRTAAVAFHNQGVVHMDFYPSNIMWKQNTDGTLDIKVIDWDAVHQMGEIMERSTRERLSRTNRYKLSGSPLTANSNLDLVLLDILEANHENHLLHSCDKLTLDTTFKSLCEKFKLDEELLTLSITDA